MFDYVAEFLAQIKPEQKTMLDNLLSQVKAGNYSETGEILLAATDASGKAQESRNEELDAVAEYMAQLSEEQLAKLHKLAQTKSQEGVAEDAELAQIDEDDDYSWI